MVIHIVIQVTIGFILAFLISWVAWKTRSLTKKGMWAAILVGGILFSSGQISWSVLILAFFLTSSLLTTGVSKLNQAESLSSLRPYMRDWGQVLANGSLGAILAVINWIHPGWTWPLIAYIGAMAAVTADTWATELGTLSRIRPRLITSGEKVDPGTSGGITPLGTISSLAGSTSIILVASFVFSISLPGKDLLFLIFAGLGGSLFDSILGATAQAIYYCPHCEKETEHHPTHSCHTQTKRIRGWSWLNNDGVNFLSSLIGAGLAVMFWMRP